MEGGGRCATTHRVLQLDARIRRLCCPDLVEIGALLQAEVPEEGTDHKDDDCFSDQAIVEDDQPDRDVVLLHYAADGYKEREDHRDSDSETSCIPSRQHCFPHASVGHAPFR